MDQDDIMHPERLATQVEFLRLNKSISLVGANVEIIDTKGDHLAFQSYPETHQEIRKQLLFGNCFAHPVVMYRKSAIESIGLYNPLFTQAEDYAMYVSFAQQFECVNLQKILLKYRMSNSQTSHQARRDQELSTRAIILKAAVESSSNTNMFPLPDSNTELASWVKSIYFYTFRNIVALRKIDRDRARFLLSAVARSHIAIARSSGYRGNRLILKTSGELLIALLCDPITTLKWAITRTLRIA
jgi:hypothetical protein